MIQRIQSLYLLIVTVLMTLTLFLNLAEISLSSETISLTPFGLSSVTGDGIELSIAKTTHMGILTLLCAIVSFLAIFMYRHRMLQVRICFALMILLAGAQFFFVYYILKMNTDLSLISYKVTDIFPIVSIILTYLAFKGVIRDEMLIKSLNRIR